MIPEYFVIVGAFINLLGGISYIADTLRGKAKPNRISWGLWALAPMIAVVAEISKGVGISALTTFMVGFTPLLIFLASFVNKKSYWKITAFDYLCGACSVAGLVLWMITKEANLAIIFAISADLVAGIPTVVKAFWYPESENWLEFLSSFTSTIILMLTLKVWRFEYYAFPLYIMLFDFVAIMLIKFRIGKKLHLQTHRVT